MLIQECRHCEPLGETTRHIEYQWIALGFAFAMTMRQKLRSLFDQWSGFDGYVGWVQIQYLRIGSDKSLNSAVKR